MIISLFNSESSYVVVTRKYFSRLVLIYEVLLDSQCYRINDTTIINADEALNFVQSGQFTDDLVLLEIVKSIQKKAYSLSGLRKIWFATYDARDIFLDRSYANFDVEKLNCDVVALVQQDICSEAIIITTPPKVSNKSDFVTEDGILALVYEKLITEPYSIVPMKNDFLRGNHVNNMMDYLFGSQSLSVLELEVQRAFSQQCLINSLDYGWDAYNVLNSLNEQLSKSVKNDHQFEVWFKKVQALITGNSPLDIPLDDNGSHVLRAIILVLLNPELDNLVAIKTQLGENIGEEVFKIAKSFVLLRAGYSLFEFQQRERLGDNRTFLQDLNAALHNKDFSIFAETGDYGVQDESSIESEAQQYEVAILADEPRFLVSGIEYLSKSEDNLEGFNTYLIDGLIPNAGFNTKLLETQNSDSTQLFYWLIDRRADNGKYKGKIGIDLLQIQSNLPSDYRFEVDASGVFLRLPPNIHNEVQLKQILTLVKDQLSIVKAINARKSSF